MTFAATQPSTAKAPVSPNKRAGEGGWTFRAPRHGDLLVCPYCDPATRQDCDHCGGEGSIYASDFFGGSDDA